MEIFVRSELTIDEVAVKLRQLLNIPEHNQTPYQLDQNRYGVNRGGEYYLFEILGLELFLLSNDGEVEIPEWREYPFYLFVQGLPYTAIETWQHITTYLYDVLIDAGWDVAMEGRGNVSLSERSSAE